MKYDADLRPKPTQKLPKKIVRSKRLPVKGNYQVYVSAWIMDVPYSKHPPGVCLTFSHGRADSRQYIRLVFEDIEGIITFGNKLADFLKENMYALTDALIEALKEWNEVHQRIIDEDERKKERRE